MNATQSGFFNFTSNKFKLSYGTVSKPCNKGPKLLYATGFVELEIAAIDLPQKLFLGKIILALFFFNSFFFHIPIFLQVLLQIQQLQHQNSLVKLYHT